MSWADVRAEAPDVFRSAAKGVLLLFLAVAVSVLWSSLGMEFPWRIALPDWIAWIQGLLIVAAGLLCVGLLIWAWALLSMPGDTRRGIAIARFARQRGLMYSRFGFAPERLGILFGGGRDAASPQGRRREDSDPTRPSLFRAGFALWQSTETRFPPLQIAVASYTGGKNDPRGPRGAFRYMEMTLPRRLPHLMIDARGNGSLRALLPGTQHLSLEGDFDRQFSVYVPVGYERDALQLLTPDVMVCLIDHGRRWDIEIVDARLVVASRRFRKSSDRAEYTAMLYFSELIGRELGHQAKSYTDPRAANPRTQIATAGTRLRLRSTIWITLAFASVCALMLAFPHALVWFLDR
ncbi:hypothetical protein ASE14_11970 [Agromyces sp. Root81]|nr:hypothetical protein ASE14_11970 [Agromyces sp. Root81]